MNTKQLLAAQKKGAQILHNGAPVTYSPRQPGDRKPWAYREGPCWHRYTAAQCQAVYPSG